ncbi:uncharacterized protein LOC143889513 [Tasmannia lanceolata]|uniref:uncharacterized protein LOC143889513 n=1 Tax=Tasmannia lanceolata TaxID=3420 RepID=UPI0040632586
MGSNINRSEAERSLKIAEKLLIASDLVGGKKFALQAQDHDPLLEGIDQILTIADVLLAAEKRINNHLDWYAILQLNPTSNDLEIMKRHYRRLVLLLHPDKNKLVGADKAFQLVIDAWNVLSDPYKRGLYDEQNNLSSSTKPTNDKKKLNQKKTLEFDVEDGDKGLNFWTTCPYCCNLYEYVRVYENCNLRCQNCKRGFHAAEIASLPPLVPGMDAYFCTWGFFPLGIPGQNPNLGFGFGTIPSVPNLGSDQNMGFSSWRPPFPMYSANSQPAGETRNTTSSMDVPEQNEESGTVGIGSRKKSKFPKFKKVYPIRNRKSSVKEKAKTVIQKKSKVTKITKSTTVHKMKTRSLGKVSTQESENLVSNGEIRENIEVQNVVEDTAVGVDIDVENRGGNDTKDICSSVRFQGVEQVEESVESHGYNQYADINEILDSLPKIYNIKDEEIVFI